MVLRMLMKDRVDQGFGSLLLTCPAGHLIEAIYNKAMFLAEPERAVYCAECDEPFWLSQAQFRELLRWSAAYDISVDLETRG